MNLSKLRSRPAYFRSFVSLVLIIFSIFAVSFAQENDTGRESEEFDFANGLFSRGMYDMAINGYRDFLDKYPASQYAEMADFRIAEAYFMDGQYDMSVDVFNRFLGKYSSGKMVRAARFRMAQAYYLKDEHAQAEAILSDIIQKAPSGDKFDAERVVAPAKYYLAGVYFKRGQHDKARSTLEDLLSANAGGEYVVYAYVNLGDIYTELGNETKAAEAYAKASEVSPDNPDISADAALRAAGAYYRQGDNERARDYYKKVMELSTDQVLTDNAALGFFSTLYRQKDYSAVINESKLILPKVKGDRARAQLLFMLGGSYFYQDRFLEAEKVYSEAYRGYPDTEYGMKARINGCWALLKTENYQKCLLDIQAYMVTTDQSMDEALYIKGRALAGMGRSSEAAEVYGEMLKTFPDSDFLKEVSYETGWLYADSGRNEDAIGYFYDFVNSYPRDERSPELLLKAAQESFKLGRYNEAEKAYMKFLSDYPKNKLKENVLYQLGSIYLEQENYDAVTNVYEKFLQEFPDSRVKDAASYWIGVAYQKKEEWDKAIEVYEGIMKTSNGEFAIRAEEASAYCYFQKGDFDKSAEAYYGIIEKNREQGLPEGIYQWVADFYMNSGKNAKSLKVLKVMNARYPDSRSRGEVLYMFAENNRILGNNEEAGQYFKKAIGSDAPSLYLERAHIGLGRYYAFKGDYNGALSEFDKALAGAPDNVTGAIARQETGNVNFNMKKYDEAAKQYMMVAILYDDEELCSDSLFKAGVSFEKAGMKDKAVETFKELVKRYPDNDLSKRAGIEITRLESEEE